MTHEPAPHDWHDANKYLPPNGEVVVVFQLSTPWAVYTGEKWLAVDYCGNRRHLNWQPEYWRREYQPVISEEMRQPHGNLDN